MNNRECPHCKGTGRKPSRGGLIDALEKLSIALGEVDEPSDPEHADIYVIEPKELS